MIRNVATTELSSFVPTLYVVSNLSHSQRAQLMDSIRSALATGDHDRALSGGSRRPRARWEPSPAQRPISKLLALGHRLTERVALSHSELSQWKVQSAGRSVEVWLCRPSTRPVLFAKFDESTNLTYVIHDVGSVTAEAIRGYWMTVVAPS